MKLYQSFATKPILVCGMYRMWNRLEQFISLRQPNELIMFMCIVRFTPHRRVQTKKVVVKIAADR